MFVRGDFSTFLSSVENEIQLAGYKILNALWIIGTQGTKFVDREWIIEELNRHRPLVGDCLSSFSSCFPVSFFEPELNGNNKNASNVSQLSPEANGKIQKERKSNDDYLVD